MASSETLSNAGVTVLCKPERVVAVVLGIDFSSTPHSFYGVKLWVEFGYEHSLLFKTD